MPHPTQRLRFGGSLADIVCSTNLLTYLKNQHVCILCAIVPLYVLNGQSVLFLGYIWQRWTWTDANYYNMTMLKYCLWIRIIRSTLAYECLGYILPVGQYGLAVWFSGGALVAINKLLYAGPFNTWTGDCLWAGTPSWYVTSHLGQLSLLSLWGILIEYQSFWLGLRWGAFSYVGWQVTLCDPIWQVTACRSEVCTQRAISFSL